MFTETDINKTVKTYCICTFSVPCAGGESLGFSSSGPVTVVLEDDGTIVEDEAYFWCLPSNTKFMLLHEKETWSPVRRSKQMYICMRFYHSVHVALCFGNNLVFLQWMGARPGWPEIP